MSSYTPQTDLPLERSRLVGMILGGIFYGIYLLLTIQATTALMQRPRRGQRIADNRRTLLCYTLITFALATLSFAGDTKYTEMIWIDLRNTPASGGPVGLIKNALHYRINFMAIFCGYAAELCMQALLLYRCFVIWNWARYVMVPMVAIYIAMIGVVLMVQAGAGALFYNIKTTLVYLVIQVVHTMLYTILVTKRLLSIRGQMKTAVAGYDSSAYDTIILMVIESAMAYSIFIIVYIVAFVVDSDSLSTLCFLSIIQIQGIAQLFIIIRVARGRAVTNDWSTRISPAAPTTLAFAGTASISAEEANVAQAARPVQDSTSVESYSVSAKLTEAIV